MNVEVNTVRTDHAQHCQDLYKCIIVCVSMADKDVVVTDIVLNVDKVLSSFQFVSGYN